MRDRLDRRCRAHLQGAETRIDAAGVRLAIALSALIDHEGAPGFGQCSAFARQGLRVLHAQALETLVAIRRAESARDALAGPVRLSDGTEGLALGIGAGGELRVQTAGGVREVRNRLNTLGVDTHIPDEE